MSLRISYDIGNSPGLQRKFRGHLLLELQEMGASEILQNISRAVQDRIKKSDPNPLYRAYVVAHEGYSEGQLVGEQGGFVKQWVQSAIRKIWDKLKAGLKIFHNHGETNEHKGRTPIGELVGSFLKTIKGRLNAIALVYIKPEYRSLPLDIASVEANITVPDDAKMEAMNVDNITGIALGNSNINTPGFPGAELIGELQAFAGKSQPIRRALKMSDEKITMDELKNLIKTEGIKPSDVFTSDQLADDPFVKGHADSKVKERIGQEYQHRKSTEESLQKKQEEWDKEKKALEEKISGLTKTASESKVKSLLEDAKEKRKLSDQQSKFIEKRLGTFNPQDIESIEKDFDSHLDSELDEFKTYAETFGIDLDKEQPPENGDDKGKEKGKPKIEADGKKQTDEGPDNPFLPPLD